MKLFLVLLFLSAALFLAFVRLAPSDPERWHIDPSTANDPGDAGYLLNLGPTFALEPAELLERIDVIAMQWPRTRRLAGSADEGRITYVTRTKWIGFPDYTTVAVEVSDGVSAPVILARLRFGGGDLGVNKTRVDAWITQLVSDVQPLDQ